ncbi:CRISPR-associated RAMP protein Csx7 [Acetomicrobium sp.]|uniref:type III CRISPR-associated RAMP protein Csx7 n=1 Tax=Acetomicrobium sp. TaxID=1872099 RepID=UPI002FCA5465
MKSFFQFENRWVITASLQMETALSVGSRASLLPAGSDLPVIKTPEGIPFIPGSSLKGVVRTYIERILRTMDVLNKQHRGERIWACDLLDKGKCCITAEQKNMLLEKAGNGDERFTQLIWQNSCTVCRLFGSQWLASRLSFQDAMLKNSDCLLRLTEVRDGVGIDRGLGSAKPGLKYDFETVPQGAEFGIHVVAENAGEWEVGLLVLALETMEKGELPIGGKTTRGLGWGKLNELKVQLISQDILLGYLAGNEQPTEKSSQDILETLVTDLKS